MTLNAHRPYCRRPILSAALNLVLCLVVIAVAEIPSLPNSIFWLAAVFAVCSILFFVLAVTAPGTTISIDGTGITRSGRILGGSLRFDEILSATVERDPDAQNYKQIIMRSKGGRTLLIDPRFLNPDSDGLVDLLRERLRQHGADLVWESATAEHAGDGKPDPVSS
jgi:hypothetical protein